MLPLGGRWVEVHHAANHARFGPRAQRTTLADVLAVPGRRHEQWQYSAGYAGDKLVGAGAAITIRDNPHVGTMWLSLHPDHQGQICMSARRLLVDQRIADDYLDRLAAKTAGLNVGDPSEPDTIITAYGLAAGILTGDLNRGLALADRLQAGIVHVNDQPVGDEPQMPFGGVKDSGWGRFGGQAPIEEFTELKWVTVQSGTRPFPF